MQILSHFLCSNFNLSTASFKLSSAKVDSVSRNLFAKSFNDFIHTAIASSTFPEKLVMMLVFDFENQKKLLPLLSVWSIVSSVPCILNSNSAYVFPWI